VRASCCSVGTRRMGGRRALLALQPLPPACAHLELVEAKFTALGSGSSSAQQGCCSRGAKGGNVGVLRKDRALQAAMLIAAASERADALASPAGHTEATRYRATHLPPVGAAPTLFHPSPTIKTAYVQSYLCATCPLEAQMSLKAAALAVTQRPAPLAPSCLCVPVLDNEPVYIGTQLYCTQSSDEP